MAVAATGHVSRLTIQIIQENFSPFWLSVSKVVTYDFWIQFLLSHYMPTLDVFKDSCLMILLMFQPPRARPGFDGFGTFPPRFDLAPENDF